MLPCCARQPTEKGRCPAAQTGVQARWSCTLSHALTTSSAEKIAGVQAGWLRVPSSQRGWPPAAHLLRAGCASPAAGAGWRGASCPHHGLQQQLHNTQQLPLRHASISACGQVHGTHAWGQPGQQSHLGDAAQALVPGPVARQSRGLSRLGQLHPPHQHLEADTTKLTHHECGVDARGANTVVLHPA